MIQNTGYLAGRTLFITGASRGIGKAIALKAARDGANVIIAAKTAEPHPKLPGTIYTAAEEVEAAGGKCLPCIVDVRDEAQVYEAVAKGVKMFGGIDILVNNASAISLTGTLQTEMKRYDLMNNINTRGTFLVSKACIPHLQKATNPHILNLSPPLNMSPYWFKNNVAYTIAKYGMSMCVLGMSEEFKQDGIAVNALWPRTAIHTAAMEMLAGPASGTNSRKPEIVADAAYVIFNKDSKSFTGQFVTDEEILSAAGVTDFTPYACVPENADQLMPDFFLEVPDTSALDASKGQSRPDASSDISRIFQAIEKSLSTNADIIKKTDAVFGFTLTGDVSGKWFIDLKNGRGSAGKGEPPCPADATLEMTSQHFTEMFTGKLKPTAAFMTGKLKISGNLQKAMKLEKLMSALKSKL
ncbi:hydroxysteroid dehydrogenase-like protein 2 [Anabrus simplex]|uniref:hydroxysteroid dehydrogenase-like protein 2 n=1 Tax=Anabrus simplex TaxID=316456 RepID=UPI0035A2F14F